MVTLISIIAGGLIALIASQATLAADIPETPIIPQWSDNEIATLRSLWIESLPPLPPDPSNKVADNPGAVSLGHRLFFDTRLSANGKVSCASCHQPERAFTDGMGRAHGISTTRRGAPTLIGAAYNAWFFWDGRSDSLWSQALGPLENEKEHGGTRTRYARILFEDPVYRGQYEDVFGPMPDMSDTVRFPGNAGPVTDETAANAWQAMSGEDREAITRVFTNMGKAIAAYERRLMPGYSAYDRYVEALLAGDKQASQEALPADAVAGLRVFIGKGMCINCHNGPLFTNHSFHNTGIPIATGLGIDEGRWRGVLKVKKSEFNCLGRYSDAGDANCAELRFAQTSRDETVGAFKVPTLRNVAETAPYTHSGEYPALASVIEHYNRFPTAPIGFTELLPIQLTDREAVQLEAFLRSLSGPPATEAKFLSAPD